MHRTIRTLFFLTAVTVLQCTMAHAVAMPVSADIHRFYSYDHSQPLAGTQQLVRKYPYGDLYRVTYMSEERQVPALLLIPPGPGPFPAVVLGHWLGGSKSRAMNWGGRILAEKGLIVLAPDHPHEGSRKGALFDGILHGTPQQSVRNFRNAVIDLRRAVDFLQTQPRHAGQPVGYAGISLGAVIGFLTVAVEPRYSAFASLVGGGQVVDAWSLARGARGIIAREFKEACQEDPELATMAANCEPVNVAPLIGPRPVAMFNGLHDTTIPPDCTLAVYDALQIPKEVYWYDSGHNLSIQAFADASEWMLRQLLGATEREPRVAEGH